MNSINGSLLRIAIFIAVIISFHIPVTAQENNRSSERSASDFSITARNGRIAQDFSGMDLPESTAISNLNNWLGLSDQYSFVKGLRKIDKLGITHISFQQYFKDIPVEDGKIMVHIKNDRISFINGHIATLESINIAPGMDENAVQSTIRKALDIAQPYKDYPVELVIATLPSQKEKAYTLAYKVRVEGKTAAGKMVLMQVFADAQTGKIISKADLVAHGDVPGTGTTMFSGIQGITVDSYNGGYRLHDNARGIETYDASGVGKDNLGYYLVNRDFENPATTWDLFPAFMSSTLQTASPSLIANTNSGQANTLIFAFGKGVAAQGWQQAEIYGDGRFAADPTGTMVLPAVEQDFLYTFTQPGPYSGFYLKMDNAQQIMVDSAAFEFTNLTPGTYNWSDANGNSGSYTISMEKNPAVDVHWGLEQTYDYYMSRFGRNSFDNAGTPVRAYMNAGEAISAGAWPAPYNFMEFGLGDGSFIRPNVSLDIVAHEYTHMLTNNNGNGGLTYQGESGALNESFSDIFATCIEFMAKGQNANWTIGEGLMYSLAPYYRSMSNPKSRYSPDTYEGILWMDPTDLIMDNGGVHTNSGVQNKWFYLLSVGGSGTNDKQDQYNVAGIGIQSAEKIAYRNLTTYLLPSSDYLDAYTGSLQAATDLFGASSPEYISVKDAWYAVGIGEKDSSTSVSNVLAVNSGFELYPNPASTSITIISRSTTPVTTQILNSTGLPVMTVTVNRGANTIDISGLYKGLYLVRYQTGGKSYTQKLSVL